MQRATRIYFATAVYFVLSVPVNAGAFRDFENQVASSYGSYRSALFATNKGNKAKSVGAITKFTSSWNGLSAKWKTSPPPQYEDDPAFPKVLQDIANIGTKALAEAGKGDLKTSHVTLERIRDILAAIRARNNIVSFSDHVNAYHAQMEKLIDANYIKAGAEWRGPLREDAAVLEYLYNGIVASVPEKLRNDTALKAAVSDISKSLATLRKAITAGRIDAVRSAIKQLKKPYAKLFVRWG